jgi:hypothetical protein
LGGKQAAAARLRAVGPGDVELGVDAGTKYLIVFGVVWLVLLVMMA